MENSRGNWLEGKPLSFLHWMPPISVSSTWFTLECVQNCSSIACCAHMLLEFSELTVLFSSFLSSYFQWEQQFHLKRKKGMISQENARAEKYGTTGTHSGPDMSSNVLAVSQWLWPTLTFTINRIFLQQVYF